jgi:hypothetical protein
MLDAVRLSFLADRKMGAAGCRELGLRTEQPSRRRKKKKERKERVFLKRARPSPESNAGYLLKHH